MVYNKSKALMETSQNQELERYPKYKQAYIKAFERMLKKRKEEGKDDSKGKWTSAEAVYNWWIGE